MRKTLFALLVLVFIINGSIQASAFSDDFNDGTLGTWNIDSGSFTATSFYVSTVGTGQLTKTVTVKPYYVKVKMRVNDYNDDSNYIQNYLRFIFFDNGTKQYYVEFEKSGNGVGGQFRKIKSNFGLTEQSYGDDLDYFIELTKIGNNLNYKLSNLTSILYEESIPFPGWDVSTSSKIVTYEAWSGFLVEARIDDITISLYEGYVPPLAAGEPFGCSFMDFSGLGDWDVVGHVRVVLNWLYTAPGCYLSGLFSYLYNTVYNIVMIPVGLITNLFTWVSAVITNIVGLIGDIYALMGTVTSFFADTIFLLLDNAWVVVMGIGVMIVVAFRIKHLLGDTTIAGFKIGRG